MKFENTQVFNFEGALRGMRNPKESWDKSDSGNGCCKETNNKEFRLCRNCGNPYCDGGYFQIGENDLKLAQTLIKAGSEHRKFMRQIFVSVDITAPLYWWKEFDTYKVGTVANSTSTMHKLADTPITKECFEMDDFDELGGMPLIQLEFAKCGIKIYWEWFLIPMLERLRCGYNELMKDSKHLMDIKEFDEAKKANLMAMKYWKELIRLLPESWLQKRTVTMDYENLLSMCSKGQRRNHKLTEWSKAFIDWARSLPYAEKLIFLDETL